MDNLDDQDDVQNVSANFNISDEVLKAIGEG
jgi:transcriptional/translational regulatory protein YebC/TACO1